MEYATSYIGTLVQCMHFGVVVGDDIVYFVAAHFMKRKPNVLDDYSIESDEFQHYGMHSHMSNSFYSFLLLHFFV